MPGRHRSTQPPSRPRRVPWLGVGLGAAAAVAAIAVALSAISSSQEPSDVADAATSPTDDAAEGCPDTVLLAVSADRSIADVVQSVAATAQAAGEIGPCVDVVVTAQNSVAVADEPITADSPALWVADASAWGDALAERAGEAVVENLGSMASSPVVLAARTTTAEQLGAGAADGVVEVAWAQALGNPTGIATIDPETSTEGIATLATLQAVLGGQPGEPPPEDLVRSYVGLSRAVLPSVADALTLLESDPQAPVVAATEQAVLARAGSADSLVVPVYPDQGTTVLDYPVLRLRGPGEADGVDEAARVLAELLLSDTGTAAAQEAGFRSPEGRFAAGARMAVQVPPQAPADIEAFTLELFQDALRTWSAVTLEARMLTVIDVSGSMDEDAGQGRTRIELARDAAVTALRLYPDSAQIGLWAFSVLLDPPADWIPLVEVGPLSDEVSGATRRDALLEQSQTLPSRVGGGTGLYDTVLAGFRTVRADYDPARVNSVVLLTDGRNEEDPDGIDLDTLLRTVRAEFDPAQPVPIITIGMGPDADVETLRQISETTGGKAYIAEDPNDIETVFLDAMIERRCRPTC